MNVKYLSCLTEASGLAVICKTIHRLVKCPGFGQDRVNFHQNPGRGTARGG